MKVFIASGGIYSEGQLYSFDFVAPYLKVFFSFIGPHDLSIFRIEGTAIPALQKNVVEKGLRSIIVD